MKRSNQMESNRFQLQPRDGFDWARVAWGRPDSPRSELCSYCFAKIDDDTVPLMLTTETGYVCQFCDQCMQRWWGFESGGMSDG
jgi:hypothetical protein